jgi:puromycin-sensitive aminopeptidase
VKGEEVDGKEGKMQKSDAVMLPADVKPIRYTLTLSPDLSDFTFRGDESIEIEVLEPTSTIALNSVEIAIQSCTLTLSDGSTLSPVETTMNEEDETAVFRFGGKLPAGRATLALEFSGELNDKLRGFYRSKYRPKNGEGEKHIATTQFEATDARRAFPCWDEPGLKASFQVTLLIPSYLKAVSNMPVVSEQEEEDGLKRVEFGETPLMSTYLLAFVVGDLRAIEQRASDGTMIRIWATAGNEEHGRFALEVSLKLMDYLNDYFGIPYPLEKLDHLAIPDFAAGAMENWGAITYRETAILVDPEGSSARTRQIVATIIAHEMAHMWFGDLVTMAWWNDLWLNESFASWMGDKAVDHIFPEWEMWTQFVSNDTNDALGLDGLKNSHPIEQEVKNPAEIGQLFDAISYSKGGSILRMLEHFLGAERFQQGLQRYLGRHKYGNARTQDLWDALAEVSGKPVAAMMDTWVKQTGYPVIDVQMSRGPRGIELTASQSRFVYEHVAEPDGADDTVWHVPLNATTAAGAQPAPLLMEGRRATMSLAHSAGESADGWVKVNSEQTGFYRVNYSPEDWSRLRPAIQGLALPPSDRLGIQNDAYALSKAGFLPVTEFLSLAEAYAGETDATVWADLAANLRALDSLLAPEPDHDRYQAYARRIFQPVSRKVGWVARPGEGHLDSLLRSTVLAELGNYGDEDALSEAQARFAGYVDEPGSVHPDIRNVVLGLAAKQGDRSTYDTMWELQKDAVLEEERLRLLRSLTRFEQPELLEETLRRSISPEVRVQNTVGMVVAVASNSRGRDLAWEFLKANWPELDRRYGEGGFALMRLVALTERFTTHQKLEDVQRFFADNPAPAAERTVRQSLETIRLNIAWLDQNRQALADWLVG